MAYRRPPITEALIDIRVELPTDVTFESLAAVRNQVSRDYPAEETRGVTQSTISLTPSVKSTTEHKQLGYALFTADKKQVFQARVDGFTFSRLEPYEDWESLRNEARRLWDIYRAVLKPISISRIAVRYINQLNLPGRSAEFEDYFKTFPQLSQQLEPRLRDISQFLMSLRIPQDDLNGSLILNEALGVPKNTDTVPIILDFDLFIERPKVIDEEGLWSLFQQLRERKNFYFEACITDKTRELIS